MPLKKLKPSDKLAAELERLISEVQAALREYRAATAGSYRRRPVTLMDPRNGKTIKPKKGARKNEES